MWLLVNYSNTHENENYPSCKLYIDVWQASSGLRTNYRLLYGDWAPGEWPDTENEIVAVSAAHQDLLTECLEYKFSLHGFSEQEITDVLAHNLTARGNIGDNWPLSDDFINTYSTFLGDPI